MNVAIFGKFCAGKTSLAAELTDEYGYVVMSLAGNLKYIVGQVYGTYDKSAEFVVSGSGFPQKKSVREILQGVGESVKQVDRDFWVRWFLRDCEDYEHIGIPVVCDDGRLVHESRMFRGRGWLIVKIDTPDDVRFSRFSALYGRYPRPSEANHRTEEEVEMVEPDLVIDGTLPLPVQAEMVIAEVVRRGEMSRMPEGVRPNEGDPDENQEEADLDLPAL